MNPTEPYTCHVDLSLSSRSRAFEAFASVGRREIGRILSQKWINNLGEMLILEQSMQKMLNSIQGRE